MLATGYSTSKVKFPCMVEPKYDGCLQGGRFVCQIRYTRHPFPSVVNGRVVPTYDSEDIQRFVLKQRPSLKGKKDVRIEFSNQKVCTK